MRLVQRLVFRETDIPVDPRKIRARTSGGVEPRIEFQGPGREFLQQTPEGLNDGGLIAVTVGIHPFLAVLTAEVFEKLKGFACQYKSSRSHENLGSGDHSNARRPGYTIPNGGQLTRRFFLRYDDLKKRALDCAFLLTQLGLIDAALRRGRLRRGPPPNCQIGTCRERRVPASL